MQERCGALLSADGGRKLAFYLGMSMDVIADARRGYTACQVRASSRISRVLTEASWRKLRALRRQLSR